MATLEEQNSGMENGMEPGKEDGKQEKPPPAVESEWDGKDSPQILDHDIHRVGVKKKKKKNNKKGKTKPTGFEEYIVEGPMTSAEVSADQELYHPSKPFSERIETCIQRYKARRKWDPLRLQIFTTYLALGGISAGSKQFGGSLDQKQMDDMDAAQIQQLAATEFVRPPGEEGAPADDGDEWMVDFEYIVRGFLSYKAPYVLGYQRINELDMACKVVRNFLNYVVYHGAAVEHVHSILAACKICDKAETELPLCRNVSNRLPGKFNMACSTLFGGYYEGMRDSTKYTWNSGLASDIGLEPAVAKDIFTVCVSKRGTPAQQAAGLNAKVLRREHISLEVTAIVMPVAGTDALEPDADLELPVNKYCRGLEALGRLKVKTWIPEQDEDEPRLQFTGETEVGEEFEIWLEKEALQFCFIGMHVDAMVHTLDSGLRFIDSVTGVMCSFFLKLDTPDMREVDTYDDEYE